MRRGLDAWTSTAMRLASRIAARIPGAHAASLLALCACGVSAAPLDSALTELEGLAFVPAGRVALQLAGRAPFAIEVERALLVDMFETTRAGVRAATSRSPALRTAELARAMEDWDGASDDWPATFLSQGEALELARARGMRLPTSTEWMFFACGPQRFAYPWGATAQRSIANTLELALDRPAPVGTFESGRSPQQVYDLLGNVAEWTADGALLEEGQRGGDVVAVMGGSFRNRIRPLFDERQGDAAAGLFLRALSRGSRADDVGMRCVVDCESYLSERLAEVRLDDGARRRLTAIGRRWGRRAVPLLESLRQRPGAPTALEYLLAGARP